MAGGGLLLAPLVLDGTRPMIPLRQLPSVRVVASSFSLLRSYLSLLDERHFLLHFGSVIWVSVFRYVNLTRDYNLFKQPI